jgi:SAM-dependent methyltransferase
MHTSVMQFLRDSLVREEIHGQEVLEVGSQNVNGSPREVVAGFGPKKYVGVDFQIGTGVDVVLDVKNLTTYFGVDCFDVVISTEMLEHAKDWREAVQQMKAVLKPGGLLILTTRGPGFPIHAYPHDYWRFTVEDFKKIFYDMIVMKLIPDPQCGHPGVLLKAIKRGASTVDLDAIKVASV